MIGMIEQYSAKYNKPPHNKQVLNEHDCVVTYDKKSGIWHDTYGRKREVKCWRFKESKAKEV